MLREVFSQTSVLLPYRTWIAERGLVLMLHNVVAVVGTVPAADERGQTNNMHNGMDV